MQNALKEGTPHEALVAFDQLFNVAGDAIWGYVPGETGLPDETISSHVREVADDPTAKLRLPAVILNKALNLINPNKIPPAPGTPPEALGHGVGAEAGDLARALRVTAVLMKALNIPTITINAGEDPAKIPIVVEKLSA